MYFSTRPVDNIAPVDDIVPAAQEVSPKLKLFLQQTDLLAIECLLLSRCIKTYHGLNVLLEQDPDERRIILEKAHAIYRVLGGPFPQLRHNSLNCYFGTGDKQLVHMNHDEHSILNRLGRVLNV